jgi:chromosome segregation ATPase
LSRKYKRLLSKGFLLLLSFLLMLPAASFANQDKLNQIQSQLAGLDPVTDEIKSAIANIQGAINKSNELKNDLKSAIEKEKVNKGLVEESKTKLDESKANLEKSNADLELAVKTLEEALTTYEAKDKELKEKLAQIEQIKSEAASEKEKLVAKKAEISNTIEQINNKKALIESSKKTISSLQSSISSLNTSINSQNAVISNINTQISNLNSTITTLGQAITTQQSVVATAQTNVNSSASSLASAASAVVSQETVVAQALVDKNNAQSSLNTANTNLQQAQSAIQGAEGLEYTVYYLTRGFGGVAIPDGIICTGVLDSNVMQPPVCGNRYENFIVKFTGQITVPDHWTTTYFAGYTDDGFRMYVDGQLAIDEWVEKGSSWSPYSPTYNVSTDKTLDVEIWWYNGGGPGYYFLGWAIPGGWTGAGCDYTGGWGIGFSCDLDTFSHGESTQEQIDAYNAAVSAQAAAQTNYNNKLAAYNTQASTLQTLNAAKSAAQSDYDNKNTSLNSANQALASLIQQKNTAESQLATASSNLQTEQNTLNKLTSDLNGLNDNLSKEQQALGQNETDLANLESTKTNLESEETNINTTISSKETELANEEQNSQKLNSEKENLYQDYQGKESAKKESEAKLEESKTNLASAEAEYQNKTTELESSAKAIEDVKNNISKTESEINNASSGAESLISKTKSDQEKAKIEAAKEAAKEAVQSGGEATPEQKAIIVESILEQSKGEAVDVAAIIEAGIDLEDLPPDTPIELENGVVLTAEIADALEVFEDVGELFSEAFSDPGKVLKAFANVGADMSPEVREKAEDIVVVTVIVGQMIVAGSIMRR